MQAAWGVQSHIFPAHAGVNRDGYFRLDYARDLPRARGGEPVLPVEPGTPPYLPRARGGEPGGGVRFGIWRLYFSFSHNRNLKEEGAGAKSGAFNAALYSREIAGLACL